MTNTLQLKAITHKKTFSRETSVSITIQANPTIVWALLTNSGDYPRWNPTVISIEGTIALGETIKLKSTLDAKRTFKLRVKNVVPNQRLVWGDGQGERTYTIKQAGGVVQFSMHEKIGGLMFPLYGRFIPSFDQSFEQFASALKKEAELINNK